MKFEGDKSCVMLRIIAKEMVVTKSLSSCGAHNADNADNYIKMHLIFFFLLLRHLFIFNVDSVFKRLHRIGFNVWRSGDGIAKRKGTE